MIRPGYQCVSCNKIWDRPGDALCQCGRPGLKIIQYEDGKVEILKKSAEAPLRLVVVVDPNESDYCMLECGHTYTHPDPTADLNTVERIGCPECWREEEPMHRPRVSTRNRLMIGVHVSAQQAC